jgi:hypothetical protein
MHTKYDGTLCQHCGNIAIWQNEKLVYPDLSTVPPPNADLDEDIRADYDEARSIVNRSPRGAAALLRLCIQKLCKQLGEPGDNLNADIGALVKKGLPVQIQRALDTVRVIGNESVHPGTIDLKDDGETANSLFTLVNIIAHDRITQPKEIEALYNTLPASKLQGIEDRDKNS